MRLLLPRTKRRPPLTHRARCCTPRNRTGRYPRRSRVYSLVSFHRCHPSTLSLYRKYEFSFHPRTKSRIVTPVVSQLGQSYLIKSSRGRPFLPYLSFYPSSLPLQVLIKLFLLLRLEVFIISRRSALSQNRRIVIRA